MEVQYDSEEKLNISKASKRVTFADIQPVLAEEENLFC